MVRCLKAGIEEIVCDSVGCEKSGGRVRVEQAARPIPKASPTNPANSVLVSARVREESLPRHGFPKARERPNIRRVSFCTVFVVTRSCQHRQ